MTSPPVTRSRREGVGTPEHIAARPEDEGREITAVELAQRREHGRWPESVRSYDYVTLTDEELDAMADHGTWPDRLG